MVSLSQKQPDPKRSLPSASLFLLVEKIPAVLWTTDLDLRLTSIAGAGLAALNVQPSDYVGACLNDLSPYLGSEAAPLVAHHRALCGEAITFDAEIMGRALHANVEPLRNPKRKHPRRDRRGTRQYRTAYRRESIATFRTELSLPD